MRPQPARTVRLQRAEWRHPPFRHVPFHSGTVQADEEGEVVERESERYAHSRAYVERLAADGFSLRSHERSVLRQDEGKDVHGDVYVFERRAAE